MDIMIDGVDFWDGFKAEKYWSPTKNQNIRDLVKNAIYSGNYTLSEKVDGNWAMIIKDNRGNFYLRSRTESVNGGYADKALWIPHIMLELGAIPNGSVLLGELYLKSKPGSRNVTTIMGCLKEKAVARQKANEFLTFYVFDCLAWAGCQLLDTQLKERIRYVYGIKEYISGQYVEISKYLMKPEKMESYIATILEKGGEGVVLKRLDGTYEQGKRTTRKSIKVKKEIAETIDCFLTGNYKPSTMEYDGKEITNWQYWIDMKSGEKKIGNLYEDFKMGDPIKPITKGWYYGWAGSVELAVLRAGQIVPICWISNITETIKKDIVENNENMKYRVAAVQAMQIEDDTKHLRHAKILQWRDDKSYTDCDGHEVFGNDVQEC